MEKALKIKNDLLPGLVLWYDATTDSWLLQDAHVQNNVSL